MSACTVEKCTKERRSPGSPLCEVHYYRQQRDKIRLPGEHIPKKFVPQQLRQVHQPRPCRYCNNDFVPFNPRNDVCKRYECQRQRGREKLNRWLKGKVKVPKPLRAKGPVFCVICLALQTKKLCSRECKLLCGRYRYTVTFKSVVGTERSRAYTNEPAQKKCPECRKVFTVRVRRDKTYCSTICGKRSAKCDINHRRRVRLRNAGSSAKISRVIRSQIYDRDQWTCQICRRKVNPKHKYPHLMSPTLDHIVPVSKGGGHEPINVQLAHWICNSRRRDVGPAQLRLLA